jgi:hypothetical protein
LRWLETVVMAAAATQEANEPGKQPDAPATPINLGLVTEVLQFFFRVFCLQFLRLELQH